MTETQQNIDVVCPFCAKLVPVDSRDRMLSHQGKMMTPQDTDGLCPARGHTVAEAKEVQKPTDFEHWVSVIAGKQQPHDDTSKPAHDADTDEVLQCYGVPLRTRRQLKGLHETSALLAVRDWINGGESRDPTSSGTAVARAVRSWAHTGESWGLALSGTVGIGKSTAAAFWLMQQTAGVKPDSKLHRRWLPATELSALDYYGEEIKQYARVRHLVIDDLGREFSDSAGMLAAKLDRIIDQRYGEMRPTLITTNLTAKPFSERYGDRIADRFRDGARWVELKGESLRGKTK